MTKKYDDQLISDEKTKRQLDFPKRWETFKKCETRREIKVTVLFITYVHENVMSVPE